MTRWAYVAKVGTPQCPDRLHLERLADRHVHFEERSEALGLEREPMVALTIDTEAHTRKILLTHAGKPHVRIERGWGTGLA